jgi:hypothetical protein
MIENKNIVEPVRFVCFKNARTHRISKSQYEQNIGSNPKP